MGQQDVTDLLALDGGAGLVGVVTDATNVYAEAGGQVADVGTLSSGGGAASAAATTPAAASAATPAADKDDDDDDMVDDESRLWLQEGHEH
ncbi:MAG: hypothetical protein VXY90_03875, partial [Pseudomonadota bacterium]|nr:hypothetical protein [Pseudomonadota bacterium]